jgi:hypothetical protein
MPGPGVGEDNAVHAIDAFMEALDPHRMGFDATFAVSLNRF